MGSVSRPARCKYRKCRVNRPDENDPTMCACRFHCPVCKNKKGEPKINDDDGKRLQDNCKRCKTTGILRHPWIPAKVDVHLPSDYGKPERCNEPNVRDAEVNIENVCVDLTKC